MHPLKGRKQTKEHIEKRAASNRGLKRSKEFREFCSEVNLKRIERLSKDPNWKHWNFKEDAGNIAIHDWIKSRYGKATECEKCGHTSNIDWANKDHKYSRDRKDWMQLCRSCHRKYDYARNQH